MLDKNIIKANELIVDITFSITRNGTPLDALYKLIQGLEQIDDNKKIININQILQNFYEKY